MGAKDRVLNTRTPRSYVLKLKQAAKLFVELTGPSPFVLIICSRTAEIFVYVFENHGINQFKRLALTISRKNFHKVDNLTFKALAAEARKHIPKKLVNACGVLFKFTETILESGSLID